MNPKLNPECPGYALRNLLAFDSRDYSINRRDAWLYGIIMGWDRSMDEIAARHGWNEQAVARLRRLHALFNKAFPDEA